jgi:hypothetical protein
MPALIWQQIDLAVWLSFFDHGLLTGAALDTGGTLMI